MQRFNNFNCTQKHYEGPDGGIKPKLVARNVINNKHYIYQKYCCALTEINIYIYTCSFIISTMGCPLSKFTYPFPSAAISHLHTLQKQVSPFRILSILLSKNHLTIRHYRY